MTQLIANQEYRGREMLCSNDFIERGSMGEARAAARSRAVEARWKRVDCVLISTNDTDQPMPCMLSYSSPVDWRVCDHQMLTTDDTR